MSRILLQALGENNCVMLDTSILVSGVSYYFTKKEDETCLFRGKFHHTVNDPEHRFIFDDVEVYIEGVGFQPFTKMLSTHRIDKVYYF
jgi:hypothetical protein